ncbi:hypothetical protein KC19_1G156100 [Ceratodon purpureus]|uniref:Uncharacterized protein n=1 Tax=Ceratodon purpureus TaxID=3225 RepID=A0A8T0J877_CERPU|nr:hypothetical protein KC19_1G156100 [Ceratodon purpureus]
MPTALVLCHCRSLLNTFMVEVEGRGLVEQAESG